ncbi:MULTISPECIES: hypothetical protein [unclassified Variovorax]|uniref:hypothetical protein n=1 Tax=unclassified Variovorax TaxID=663243 RepID=UPI00076C51B2|nr:MULTISPECIES: hypothetical protein [unclassified Variovorax]KWT69531.1 hypothetical protein APY03_6891 [Variovorax sp. WDL1]PNG48849.1 hypothetical protein CHC06_06617 [Variovorax sp. B2]PNG49356.1 hypothetical protein CHC07_06265 [Variovorax sp. B4]VTV18350.1 hypothetical protein WDL1P2_00059 [Variovorax sp. WDL1]
MADLAPQIAQLNKAVEFAHYLAKGAERLIEAANARDLIQMRIDEGEETEEDLEASLSHAQETVSEFTQGLRGDIYEFRKRADRIGPIAVPAAAPVAPAQAPTLMAVASEQAATPNSAQPGGLAEVPDYVPAAQRGPGLTTYWLWYGKECVSTVRMPPGTGAVDVRNEAAKDAEIFCDRARGENPGERRTKIRHSIVKVYDDRPVQESMRRERPFEFRGLFPSELPFLELTFRSPEPERVAEVHVRDIAMGLQNVALSEGLEVSFKASEGAQRLVHVESADREAIGRVELALKAYLAERGAELVSEFGVGYLRVEPDETEPEMERPRG